MLINYKECIEMLEFVKHTNVEFKDGVIHSINPIGLARQYRATREKDEVILHPIGDSFIHRTSNKEDFTKIGIDLVADSEQKYVVYDIVDLKDSKRYDKVFSEVEDKEIYDVEYNINEK